MRAEGENVGMKQRPRGRIVYIAHVAGEAFQPRGEMRARRSVGLGQ